MRIGLFGGTFNPPHAAHRAVSLFALKRLRLDVVWWLVTPGNPLKDLDGLPSLGSRLERACAVAAHPRIAVTGIEAVIDARFTVDTVAWLRRRCPGVRFVWIMGADYLGNFHRWRSWRRLAGLLPIAIVDRGGTGLASFAAPGPSALLPFRLPEHAAATLADRRPPAWVFLHGLKSRLSSTALRAAEASAPSG
jgi:nicotinate-nucleotide adenylyltransferase